MTGSLPLMTMTIALKKGSMGLLSHNPIEHATAASDVFGFEPADLFPIVFFWNLILIYSKKLQDNQNLELNLCHSLQQMSIYFDLND